MSIVVKAFTAKGGNEVKEERGRRPGDDHINSVFDGRFIDYMNINVDLVNKRDIDDMIKFSKVKLIPHILTEVLLNKKITW